MLPVAVAAALVMALPASAQLLPDDGSTARNEAITAAVVGAVAGVVVATVLFPPAPAGVGIGAIFTTQTATAGMMGAVVGFVSGTTVWNVAKR